MSRKGLTAKNLFDKRPYKRVELQNPYFRQSIGAAEERGIWLIYGPEKNGKTWLTLQLADDLSTSSIRKLAYISAEEGTDDSFREACNRAGITTGTRITFYPYMPVDEIVEMFSKPRTSDIIFIDNLLVYQDELKGLALRRLSEALPNKLLVCVAHEERKKPYPASAQTAKKLAKVIINVKGLKAFIVSRFAPQGGEIIINDDMSEMYWGTVNNEL